ncbi:MAG: hypothetical protein JNK48_28040 [Bryobacterales bacterium]|nr:hypothetical protein [Bryobacterales bacterium]
MANKFILIDQSISSIAGHHYEYAMHVLEAAQRAGFEPYLAANRRFPPEQHPPQWRTLPLYEAGFWDSEGVAESSIVKWLQRRYRALRFRYRLSYHFSLFGLLWAVRHRFTEFLLQQPLDRTHLASLVTLLPAAVLLKLARLVLLLLLLPVMVLIFLWRSTGRLMLAGGFPQLYLKELYWEVADTLRLPRELMARRIGYMKWWKQYRSLRSFQKDTEQMLDRLRPGAGDIVFIPTLSAIDMMGLAEALKSRPAGPSWHLLFRRDIYPGREAGYDQHEWRVQGLRQSMAVSREKMQAHDVRFYTDTDELTQQYNRLGVGEFRTVPIPHTHAAVPKPAALPLRVIYVGDARREKGYHFIPRLMEDLWTDYIATGKLTFHLQSNFNIPNGEPEAVIARRQLEYFAAKKPGAVELFTKPLTSAQYKDFVLSGDLNLLFYDANNYYARSSGILVESLSAGMPVIVPAGSWLARQFQPAWNAYHATVLEQAASHTSLGMEELSWTLDGAGVDPVDGELSGVDRAKPTALLAVPTGATHLLLDMEVPAKEAVIYVEQSDAAGYRIGRRMRRVLEPGKKGKATDLVAIHDRARKITLALGGGTVRGLGVHLLSCEGSLPLGAVGVVYHDTAEIAPLVRDLVEHHEHYLKTARAFARNWQSYHNSDRLVGEIAG